MSAARPFALLPCSVTLQPFSVTLVASPWVRRVRRCRRMAAQREAVRKNQEAIGAHRKKKEEEASGGAPEAVLVEETVPEMLTPAAAAYGVVVDMKRDAYGTEPVSYPLGDPRGRPPLPPVVINPAFLPVDAYFGVPPKRFDL